MSRQNKIFVVRYFDKYGIAHTHAYAILENAQQRYKIERKTQHGVTLKCKRGLNRIPKAVKKW